MLPSTATVLGLFLVPTVLPFDVMRLFLVFFNGGCKCAFILFQAALNYCLVFIESTNLCYMLGINHNY